MNVLLLGSGGREHALAWKMAQSPLLTTLFIAPGNAGTSLVGTNVAIPVDHFNQILHFIIHEQIDMVVVGPEAPLVDGITDFIHAHPVTEKLKVLGPSAAGARLEGSKVFAKEFLRRHQIPTAASQTFDKESLEDAMRFIETSHPPFVLKADGLAAGKGVIICHHPEEAKAELKEMLLHEKFGKASHQVLIEEYLRGIELSAFVLTDGKSYQMLPAAKDYKRIGEGDTGPNTGGMGSISPVPFADDVFMKKVEDRIIRPTILGLKAEDIPYTGFIFFGLMNVKGDPYLIEYNVRMGDPEAEAIIPRITRDILELFDAACSNRLADITLQTDDRYCATVMLVSAGYPGQYEKGKAILHTEKVTGSILFHAGTALQAESGTLVSNGGRVMAVASMADTLERALEISYNNAGIIHFDGMYYRKDLGKDLL